MKSDNKALGIIVTTVLAARHQTLSSCAPSFCCASFHPHNTMSNTTHGDLHGSIESTFNAGFGFHDIFSKPEATDTDEKDITTRREKLFETEPHHCWLDIYKPRKHLSEVKSPWLDGGHNEDTDIEYELKSGFILGVRN